MPPASVVAFLELAGELRLLTDADLARFADSPDSVELPVICERLVASGALTRYQSDRVLTGRGYTLGFAGYTVLDEVAESAFRAIDPVTRTEVRLHRFPVGFTPPARSPHPALPRPVATGVFGGQGYAVYERPDGDDLATLVADMGPMPALLAAEYTRQAAAALTAAHTRGLVHARISPAGLFVGPLVQASKPKADGSPRFRPGPTATVTVADFGLPTDGRTPADDVFQMGGVLFHLLTGRNPGEASLSSARPDCPAELAALTNAMLAQNAADRPTMAEVVSRLSAQLSPAGQPDAGPLGVGATPELSPANVTLAETEQVELMNDPPRLVLADGWAGHPAMAVPMTAVPPVAFTPPAWVPSPAEDHSVPDEPVATRRPRPTRGGSRQMIWLLVGAFLVINLLAVLVWALMIFNPFAKK